MPGIRAILVLSLAIASLSGCATSSVMVEGRHGELPIGAPGVATLVFIRPSSFAFAREFRVIDHAGHFVGDALPGSYFVVRTPPGEYVFIVGGEDVDVLYANVAPGLVYYVEVTPVAGSLSAKTIFRPVKPGAQAWNDLAKVLSRRRQWIPDFARGQAVVDRDPGTRARIERAKHLWASLSPDERMLQSLAPEQGAAFFPQPPPPLPATPPATYPAPPNSVPSEPSHP